MNRVPQGRHTGRLRYRPNNRQSATACWVPPLTEGKDFAVVQLSQLKWPNLQCIPSPRFRLFVAADVAALSAGVLSEFGYGALTRGMVYFCVWGDGCERFHDVVDEILLDDELGERRFCGQGKNDVVMTTWHAKDSLERALDFFASCAVPTDGLAANSEFRLVLCCGDQEWTRRAKEFLQFATFCE